MTTAGAPRQDRRRRPAGAVTTGEEEDARQDAGMLVETGSEDRLAEGKRALCSRAVTRAGQLPIRKKIQEKRLKYHH